MAVTKKTVYVWHYSILYTDNDFSICVKKRIIEKGKCENTYQISFGKSKKFYNKDEFGRVLYGRTIFLKRRNDEKAIQLFSEYFEQQKDQTKDETKKYKRYINNMKKITIEESPLD